MTFSTQFTDSFSSSPPQKPFCVEDIYKIQLRKNAKKKSETVMVSEFSAPISKSVRNVGCGGRTYEPGFCAPFRPFATFPRAKPYQSFALRASAPFHLDEKTTDT